MESDLAREERIAQLEKKLAAQQKINKVLMERVEHSVNDTGGAYSLFERNITLQKSVEARTHELKRANAELQRMIEETKRAKEAVEEANRRLQKLDQMKSDFLSSVSHELRTPLTSIRGFAQLVVREFSRSFAPLAGEDAGLKKKSQRIQENLEIILKESERLTRLINDVLDLAKIESGRIVWRDAELRVKDLLQDAAKATQGLFALKPAIEVRLEIEEDLPPFRGDADRIEQVLVNLLNNAAKFTERGSVILKAFLNSDRLIQIEVHDTGIGFLPEDAESIFDKFQQARHGDTLLDRPKGTGLGLAISKEIIERHGGRIWARSQPGVGSVFSFTLPPVVTSPTTIPAGERSGIDREELEPRGEEIGEPRGKVLVVDDDPAVRNYLAQLLQEQGYEVFTASDGQAAIACAKEYRPDLITMDLAMPGMDGRTTIVKLHSDSELKHIPILVVSALSGWDKAGGDMAMCKPIDETRFLEKIHLLLGGGKRSLSKRSHFLVLCEAEGKAVLSPSDFPDPCHVDFCRIQDLPSRIQSGFQGMVVIPTTLVSKVDLVMLRDAPLLEMMIVPVSEDQHDRSIERKTP